MLVVERLIKLQSLMRLLREGKDSKENTFVSHEWLEKESTGRRKKKDGYGNTSANVA